MLNVSSAQTKPPAQQPSAEMREAENVSGHERPARDPHSRARRARLRLRRQHRIRLSNLRNR
jgi:hypothetical protein